MNTILYTPLAFWQCVVLWELAMFCIGFAYGAVLGNAPHKWYVRGIAGGTIFAFFYVAVPFIEWDERRTRRRMRDAQPSVYVPREVIQRAFAEAKALEERERAARP